MKSVCLLVGGGSDGWRMEVDADLPVIRVIPPISFSAYADTAGRNDSEVMAFTPEVYVRTKLRNPTQEYNVYVHSSQHQDNVIQLLIDGYNRSATNA